MGLDHDISIQDVILFIPPLIGGLLGARYAEAQTVRERVTSYLIAATCGVSVGAGIAEYLHLGPWTQGAVMFTLAAVGQEAVAYVIAALRQGITDPASAAGKWIDAVLGRRK